MLNCQQMNQSKISTILLYALIFLLLINHSVSKTSLFTIKWDKKGVKNLIHILLGVVLI